MSAPFMQLYVADYLGDTQHLTTEQHGAYLLLLMNMWRQGGSLPAEGKTLARITRVSARRWHLIEAEVMAFFDNEEGRITQRRLVEEYQKAVSKSEKRSISGKAGGSAKSLKSKDPAVANAKQLPKHSSEPEPYTKKDTEAAASDAEASPIDYRDELWREGRASLIRQTGKTDSQIRPLVGKLLREAKDDARMLLSVIRQAEADRIVDPLAWVSAAIRNPPKPLRQNERIRLELLGENHEPIQPDEFRTVDADFRRRAGTH